ncbi:MAG: hypothetical protein IGS39_01800 [Calothrix sp. C42_A2020_038]|nr:hypothetical protein [Calothrix sp. C42_A2020_038]
MVNVSQVLLSHFRRFNPDFSITDLKALFRGYRYVEETIKLAPILAGAIAQKPNRYP